jgi:hypothetical protein
MPLIPLPQNEISEQEAYDLTEMIRKTHVDAITLRGKLLAESITDDERELIEQQLHLISANKQSAIISLFQFRGQQAERTRKTELAEKKRREIEDEIMKNKVDHFKDNFFYHPLLGVVDNTTAPIIDNKNKVKLTPAQILAQFYSRRTHVKPFLPEKGIELIGKGVFSSGSIEPASEPSFSSARWQQKRSGCSVRTPRRPAWPRTLLPTDIRMKDGTSLNALMKIQSLLADEKCVVKTFGAAPVVARQNAFSTAAGTSGTFSSGSSSSLYQQIEPSHGFSRSFIPVSTLPSPSLVSFSRKQLYRLGKLFLGRMVKESDLNFLRAFNTHESPYDKLQGAVKNKNDNYILNQLGLFENIQQIESRNGHFVPRFSTPSIIHPDFHLHPAQQRMPLSSLRSNVMTNADYLGLRGFLPPPPPLVQSLARKMGSKRPYHTSSPFSVAPERVFGVGQAYLSANERIRIFSMYRKLIMARRQQPLFNPSATDVLNKATANTNRILLTPITPVTAEYPRDLSNIRLHVVGKKVRR